MWIDDTSADVIKVDFDALYHGDVLVEGDTSEQLDDGHALPAAGLNENRPAGRSGLGPEPAILRSVCPYLSRHRFRVQ